MKENTSRIEFWKKMISPQRLSDPSVNDTSEKRSVFDMDHDRIVYSNYFRRLHDKTQVFPYAPVSSTSQARSRLSHSLEVSCVGRSLGFLAGQHLLESGIDVVPYDFGIITSSACLAHDIGNPPFGHAGEDAIKEWSKDNLDTVIDSWELKDIHNFEGNAQGFRILTRLEAWQRYGGLRTTLSTLGAFIKYPCSSVDMGSNIDAVSQKKFGFFKDDCECFQEIFDGLGISKKNNSVNAYPRYPLAFLTEAADDICYAIVDLEDAYHLGIIPFEETRDLLMSIAGKDFGFKDDKTYDNELRLARYRSAAISTLVNQVIDVFKENIEKIESFSFDKSLIAEITDNGLYNEIKRYSFSRIYSATKVMEIESAGFTAIKGLLDIFATSILTDTPNKYEIMNRNIIPQSCLQRREKIHKRTSNDEIINDLSKYERMLAITDFISGMTDRYLVELYQRLSGIRLPAY